MKNVKADNIVLGNDVIIEPTAVIRGLNGNAKEVVIGDNVYIGHNVQIICDNVSIGDYSKIHHHTNIHGYRPCIIGHNAWIGQYCIIDSIGGTTIGDNCGIGAHSQLWSHIKYGDTLEGCNFLSESPLIIGKDVWLVGHCIVSPITAKDKSMALVGSVITKDMEENTVYAGVPSKAIENLKQFKKVSMVRKVEKMNEYIEIFGSPSNIKVVQTAEEISLTDDITYFILASREYTKKRTKEEIQFMKFLLPHRAKFTPHL